MSAPRLSAEAKAAIVADYGAGVPAKIVALAYSVDPTYPRILARRAGLPARYPKLVNAMKRVARKRYSAVRLDALTAGLDAEARACFERCRAGGLPPVAAAEISRDDMRIRARVARRQGRNTI